MTTAERGWHRRLYIDGRWTDPVDGAIHQIIEPATGQSIGTTAAAGHADVDRAVAAAEGSDWPQLMPDHRAQILHRLADLITQREQDIARRLTGEQGKPLADALKEIRFAVQVFHYYAEQGRRIFGSLRPSTSPDLRSVIEYSPVGIVGAIVPWNYPVDLYSWKVGPALAAGCPVISKPPLDAPGAVGMIVQAAHDAGMPAGALADLPGEIEVGQALVQHSGIAAITATASTATGRAIMARAAPTLKHLVLELGGHSPFLVLEDADIDAAATAAVRRSFSNMGQICIAVNRILVDRSVHDTFVDAIVDRTRKMRIGNGLDDSIDYGPIFNSKVLDTVSAHVADAVNRGGRLLTGGHPIPDTAPGRFYQPTIVDDVPADARMMTEETFGPAVGILAADGDAELLDRADALPYGLAAYIYTNDLERGWAIASRLHFGGVGINVNDVTELQAPFGGWKLSGQGSDLGPEGLQQFLVPKHVRMRVHSLI